MSSTRSFDRPRFPDSVRAPVQRALNRWIRRRGAIHPPMTLGYRQVFILPTAFGWMIGLLLFSMLMGSLNFNNNLGLLTTFLVAGIALLSLHVAYRNLEGLSIDRTDAEPVFAGQDARLRIALAESRGRGRIGLVAENRPHVAEPGIELPSHGGGHLTVRVPTRTRGWMELPRIRLRTRHPLGLFEAWSWFWPAHRILVWPAPAEQAPPLPASPDRDASSLPGDESDEFHGLRTWREGDPLHRIAWKASQRHNQLLARQFTRPRRGRTMLRLTAAPGRDLEERIGIVARWVMDADHADIDYGLDLERELIEPASGPAHRNRCLNALAEY